MFGVAQIDAARAAYRRGHGGRPASASRNRTYRCRAAPIRTDRRACRRPSDSAACRPADSGATVSIIASMTSCGSPTARPPSAWPSKVHAGQSLALAMRRAATSPPCTMPKNAWPGARAKARLRALGPAQRKPHGALDLGLSAPAAARIRRAASGCRSRAALDLHRALRRQHDGARRRYAIGRSRRSRRACGAWRAT